MAGTPGDHSPWPTVGKLVAALVATGVLAAGLALPYVGGLGLAAGHEASKFLDTSCNLIETQPPQKTTLYANDGTTVIATLFSQDRQPVPLSQIPKGLQDALVATEDRRFYSHHGVDMRGLVRSAVSTSGGATQGGSTLTMQYVKQMRYYQAGKNVQKQQAAIDQNLNRKIEDAKCALYLENTKHESKATILDNYLNIAFFGENSYGIQTAAETYFNKPASKLTLPESALLVGLLRAPTEYDPFVNPEASKARRNQVLQNLVDVHKLDQATADKYKATPVNLATTKPPVVKEGCANADNRIANAAFFCQYAVNWLESTGGISDTQLTSGGLKIVTTLDANLQNSMQQHLTAGFPATSPMTAVLPAVDPHTGNILAMVTNKLYGTNKSSKDITHTSLPIFTSYSSSGASTYKLFSLLTALQTGVPSTWTIGTNDTGSGYTPSNCYGVTTPATNGDANISYSVNESLSSGTAKSSNTFYVGMDDSLFGCNLQPIVNMALRLGMNGLKESQDGANGKTTIAQDIVTNQNVFRIALGSGIGTSPLELAGAYAAVANGGKYNAPAPILSIKGPDGRPLPGGVKRSPAVQVISPQVAAQAVSILAGDTRFPGTSAQQFQTWYAQNPSVIAGKTGTAVAGDVRKNSALWFVGMTPNLVATSAVINPAGPSQPIPSLPGVTDPAHNAYGDYASQLWLNALTPTLSAQQWTWTDPNAPTLGDPVPSVVGLDMATAKARLTSAGFKMAELDAADQLQCASALPLGTVAFAGPQLAPKGSTITVCPSNGIQQHVYAPPPVIKKTPTPT
ncbi:MAG: Membrane carboxypeptidase (Penicillin-binding protein), partial [Pseudonocardiales bacterium]|nr:Membrane carboxypeptidase (Penicillin-binding protein) [Pseudonocardiales bacterium]